MSSQRLDELARHGTTQRVAKKGPSPRPLGLRLRNRIAVEPASGCWVWLGKRAKGYGRIKVGSMHDGTRREVQAHRLVYEILIGPIPYGLELDHLCLNRSCVNPDHVEPVTTRENLLRGTSSPAQNARKTHCKRGHEFTPDNTRLTSRGYRQCRQCDYEIRGWDSGFEAAA
jgi:hypothetical protein